MTPPYIPHPSLTGAAHDPRPAHSLALQTALGDLLRVHAPGATLLAQVGDDVLRVDPDGLTLTGQELVPPDAWFERGEMGWLSRGGELLGLLWSESGPVPQLALDVLTMLLSAARSDSAHREAEVLVTQLPVATAWLTPDLVFRRVSRPFLELCALTDAEVLGQTVAGVLPGRPGLLAALAQAAAGRSVRLPDEPFEAAGRRWVRGEARPYLGGSGAGVMLTLQDVTGEYERGSRISALLDTRQPAALLSASGTVLHASPGLSELAPTGAPVPTGAPLWTWPCFAEVPCETVRGLIQLAAGGGAARADVALAGGGVMTLSVRRAAGSGLLVAEGVHDERGAQTSLGLISQVLALSEDATLMVDASGRAQLVSDRAAALLGVEAARLVGLGISRVLGEMGVRVFTPEGHPLALPDWREVTLPLRRELLLALPDGTLRHMELRATAVETEGVAAAAGSAVPGTLRAANGSGALLTLRDITALRRAQAKMHHDARHDALTGLLNRAGLREALGREEDTDRADAGVVVGLDIDGFGALNAALGRVACDRVLIGLAARLNDLVADQRGHAARLADDSFAVALYGLTAAQALSTLDKVLDAPLRAGGREVGLTFARGVVALHGATPEQALGDAEIAVQHARRQGRAQVSVFEPDMRAQVTDAFELEEALRGALEGNQFTLLYQPMINLQGGQPIGAETLLRWQHPTRGLLTPGHFLPLAGRSDLITHIGEWVVHEALRGRGSVQAALPGRFGSWRVSVNLGLEELRRSAGLGRLLPLLDAQGAPDIEVAAGSLLDHSQETLGLLEQLRGLGAHLSVDDFGDGASSLSALTRFPLSAVKLHPTLTARLPGDRRGVALVQGTVDLAHRLGLSVVAVGVETEQQLQMLRELGCDAAQGYAICEPLPAPELIRWLRER